MAEIGIRLAIRHEGPFVNAYLAVHDRMDGAVLLGSLALGIAENREFFDRWKGLMSDALAAHVRETIGQESTMTEREAPEHERSGNG